MPHLLRWQCVCIYHVYPLKLFRSQLVIIVNREERDLEAAATVHKPEHGVNEPTCVQRHPFYAFTGEQAVEQQVLQQRARHVIGHT